MTKNKNIRILKIGDKIKVIEEKNLFYNNIGIVKDIDSTRIRSIFIELDGFIHTWIEPSQIKILSAKPYKKIIKNILTS